MRLRAGTERGAEEERSSACGGGGRGISGERFLAGGGDGDAGDQRRSQRKETASTERRARRVCFPGIAGGGDLRGEGLHERLSGGGKRGGHRRRRARGSNFGVACRVQISNGANY